MTDNAAHKRIAVTGINGFVGKHLARELYGAGNSVIGIGTDEAVNAEIAEFVNEYFEVDLTEAWPEIGDVDAIIHLAGLAAVGPSFDNPQKYIDLNSAMITHMCESYLNKPSSPRIVIVSSGAVYESDQPMPLSEDSEIAFASPYVVSKVLVENQAAYYRRRGLECVVMRPFNHIGPGQLPGFLLPDLATQLKDAAQSGFIKVGDLTTKRDYTDVRDVARAYRLVATQEKLVGTTYNVCSGKSVSGNDLLNELESAMGLLGKIEVEIDQSRIRPTDARDIYGSAEQLKQDTGWIPEIPLSQTLGDFLETA